MKILVTGGAGYIGSHACKVLARRGFEPIVFDNLSRGNRWAVKWGPLELGDIANSVRLRTVLEQYRPAALMHFAAYAYVGESVEDPHFLIRTKWLHRPHYFRRSSALKPYLSFSHQHVRLMGRRKRSLFPRTIHSVPLIHTGIPNWSSNACSPISTRRAACDRSRFATSTLRAPIPMGRSVRPMIQKTHLIPLVLAAARDGKSVSVFGDDYDTTDGTCIRDYVHVLDIAEAHVLALEYLLRGEPSCSLNLANARGYSVKEVIATAERVSGRRIRVNITPRRVGDPAVLIGAFDRAQATLGWEPARSDLQIQIRDAWNWMRGQFVRRRPNSPHL